MKLPQFFVKFWDRESTPSFSSSSNAIRRFFVTVKKNFVSEKIHGIFHTCTHWTRIRFKRFRKRTHRPHKFFKTRRNWKGTPYNNNDKSMKHPLISATTTSTNKTSNPPKLSVI